MDEFFSINNNRKSDSGVDARQRWPELRRCEFKKKSSANSSSGTINNASPPKRARNTDETVRINKIKYWYARVYTHMCWVANRKWTTPAQVLEPSENRDGIQFAEYFLVQTVNHIDHKIQNMGKGNGKTKMEHPSWMIRDL